jgi:hypothetical protein
MLELKLAEYNLETGKFERFLELDCHNSDEGKTFSFNQDYIETTDYDNICQETYCAKTYDYTLDKKDPLNRFNGLFDGRTYGEGKFVLIEAMDFEGTILWLDDIYETYGRYSVLKYDNYLNEFVFSHSLKVFSKSPAIFCCGISEIIETAGAEYIGSLHENPELWEKVK